MGSDSDLAVMSAAAEVLAELDVSYKVTIVSAHRTPERLFTFAKTAASQGFQVIIAGAGGSAHLPGMVASLTELPVIGVPVQTKTLAGLDSLYSIVQMPPGIPVATMAINGAKNAGLLAAKILALHNPTLRKKLQTFTLDLTKTVLKKAEQLEKVGYKVFMEK